MLKSNFTGEITVFADERKGYKFYSTSMGSKNVDDTWDNAYIGLKFKKDIEFENKEKINIIDGFLTFKNWKSGDKKGTNWYIVVMEFERLDEPSEPDPTDSFRAIENECPF